MASSVLLTASTATNPLASPPSLEASWQLGLPRSNAEQNWKVSLFTTTIPAVTRKILAGLPAAIYSNY